MSGFVGDLSPKQEDALRKVCSWNFHVCSSGREEGQDCTVVIRYGELSVVQLRVAVSGIEKDLPDNDDYFYLRWLRGRCCNS